MKTLSKSELAAAYGVSLDTLSKRLKTVPNLETGRRRLLYPNELTLIYLNLGEPLKK